MTNEVSNIINTDEIVSGSEDAVDLIESKPKKKGDKKSKSSKSSKSMKDMGGDASLLEQLRRIREQ